MALVFFLTLAQKHAGAELQRERSLEEALFADEGAANSAQSPLVTAWQALEEGCCDDSSEDRVSQKLHALVARGFGVLVGVTRVGERSVKEPWVIEAVVESLF